MAGFLAFCEKKKKKNKGKERQGWRSQTKSQFDIAACLRDGSRQLVHHQIESDERLHASHLIARHPLITSFRLGCVIAQAFFSRGASAISLKSRVFSLELNVI